MCEAVHGSPEPADGSDQGEDDQLPGVVGDLHGEAGAEHGNYRHLLAFRGGFMVYERKNLVLPDHTLSSLNTIAATTAEKKPLQ